MSEDERAEPEQDEGGEGSWARRGFLAATGLATLGASMGSGSGATATSSSAQSEAAPHSGGVLEVGRFGFDTINAAWDAASNGDIIRVTGSYDAQEVGEEFPIVLDHTEKQVMLSGGHPSGTVIDAGDSDKNVIEVLGMGQEDYRNNPIAKNLEITGGQVGIYIRAAPFASFDNVILYDTGSHGVLIDEYTDLDGVFKGSFGVAFYNCQAWNCDGDGFRSTADAHPHETYYLGCNSVANKGAGYRIRGTAAKIYGGDAQLNYDFGIDARAGRAMSITGVYVEGNGRGQSYPIDMYAKNTPGLNVQNCYFHGINPRSTPGHDYQYVQRGLHLQDVEFGNVQNCTSYRYGDGLIALYDCLDVDINRNTQYKHDSELVANGTSALVNEDLAEDGNTRIRSNGIILPQDLRNVDGKFNGDFGLHVGEHGGPAFWYDGSWYVAPVQKL